MEADISYMQAEGIGIIQKSPAVARDIFPNLYAVASASPFFL